MMSLNSPGARSESSWDNGRSDVIPSSPVVRRRHGNTATRTAMRHPMAAWKLAMPAFIRKGEDRWM